MKRRLFVVAFLTGVFLAPSSPALADPATPTNYRSTVDTITPSAGYTAEVIGGDAFVRLSVPLGLDLVVLGYEGEPYIWFQPDGTVAVNQRSPATYLNDDRYAAVALPADADPQAEPSWEQVASGGSWSWHDHRTHWMARTPPALVAEAEEQGVSGVVPIFEWSLPLVVNGEDGAVQGNLVWVPASSPLPWAGVVIVTAVAVVLATRQWPWFASAGVTVAAAAAAAVGIGAFLAQPADVRTVNVDLIGPFLAGGLAGYALWRHRTQAGMARRVTVVAAAALGAWSLLRVSVLQHPLLPTVLPFWIDRLVTAVSLGVALGVVAVLLVASARREPEDTANLAGPEPA